MKVHRIITTIEVENDNSITSVELTKLYPASDCVNKHRLGIDSKLKGIARIINDSLDNHDYNVITDDNTITETNDDLLL